MSKDPIHYAARDGDLSVVKELLQAGASVEAKDKDGRTPLISASRNGNLEVVKYLVKEGVANVEAKDKDCRTPLIHATWFGKLEVIEYLVEQAGVNVEAKNNKGMTPLMNASYYGRLEVVKYLVEAGANVEDKDDGGNTPLIWASKLHYLEVVKYLVEEAGANVEAKNNRGMTPLMNASYYGRLEVVKYLVKEAGANVEAKDEDGSTPLIFASYYGDLEVVIYLVKEAGADAGAIDNNGKTALEIAMSRFQDLWGEADEEKVGGLRDIVIYLERGTNVTTRLSDIQQLKFFSTSFQYFDDSDDFFSKHFDPFFKSPESPREMEQRQFYNSALLIGTSRPQQVRLLTSGPWGLGKTSTVRSLLGEPFNPEYDSTEGVEIQTERLGRNVSFTRVYMDWQNSGGQMDEFDNLVDKSSLLEDAQRANIPQEETSSPSNFHQNAHTASDNTDKPDDLGTELSPSTTTGEVDLAVEIWDFAGQLVYHAMHQAFFRSNCLYLLVLDLRPDNARSIRGSHGIALTEAAMLEDAQKWLNAIVSSAGTDIGLLIVGTHADHFNSQEKAEARLGKLAISLEGLVADVEHDEVLKHAPQLVVDNKSGLGIPKLKEAIQKTGQDILNKLPDIPIRWLRLSEKLSSINLQENHFCLKLSDLHLTATAVGISHEELIGALNFLDQIGTIIYSETEGLNESVFLQPHLLLNAMKSLLAHKSQPVGLGRNQWRKLIETGVLGKEALKSMWEAQGFQDQDQVLRILALYGLIIDLKPCVVVPCLMSEDPLVPLKSYEGEAEIMIQTKFSKHLPPSLFGFLLAGMHRRHGVQHQDVGLICCYAGCLTLKASTAKHTFRVMLSSKNLDHTIEMYVRGMDEEGGRFQDSKQLVQEALSLTESMHSMLGERYQSYTVSSYVTGTKMSTTHTWLLLETKAGNATLTADPCVTHCHVSGIVFRLLDCISNRPASPMIKMRPAQNLEDVLPPLDCSVFISHTGADKDAASFAGFLRFALKYKYQTNSFLDSKTLKTGENWCKKIEDHAKVCKVFVALLSEHYFYRFWCLHELDLALQSGCVIVPVFFGSNVDVPKADSAFFAQQLHEMLSKKNLDEELYSVLTRWLTNMTTLKHIQGMRNSSSHKQWMSMYCDEVAATVWDQLQKQL